MSVHLTHHNRWRIDNDIDTNDDKELRDPANAGKLKWGQVAQRSTVQQQNMFLLIHINVTILYHIKISNELMFLSCYTNVL